MPTLANLKKQAQEINEKIEKRKLEIAINQHKDKVEKHNKKAQEAAEPPPTGPSTDTE